MTPVAPDLTTVESEAIVPSAPVDRAVVYLLDLAKQRFNHGVLDRDLVNAAFGGYWGLLGLRQQSLVFVISARNDSPQHLFDLFQFATLRLLLGTGFLGGFTTYSALATATARSPDLTRGSPSAAAPRR